MKTHQVSVKYLETEEIKANSSALEKVSMILELNNENFTPSLFERITTNGSLKEKVKSRVEDRIKDEYNYLLAFIGNEIVGFTELKFEKRLVNEEQIFVLAIGTSAVNPSLHGLGIAKELYKKVEELAETRKVRAVTRSTWSTNYKQLKLYEKFGYKEYDREVDGRGPSVDLVKFAKEF